MAQRFGGRHTETKLDKLEAYLRVFTTALKKQNFELIYFDAFAGTGDIQIGDNERSLLTGADDFAPFIRGSAQRALQFGDAFKQYIFVDANKRNVNELRALRDQHPSIADRIAIRHGDANDELQKFCEQMDTRRTRAIVFLDPYGNQVRWSTIEAIARTQAIDLWYLFPAGLGVYRQISKRAGVSESCEASLDSLLGTKAWRDSFIETRPVADLFGDRDQLAKVASPESITRFMVGRMKTIFAGGVLDEWLPLGSRGIHMYSLLFAWANPSEKARLAGKLALAVLRSGRGRA